MQSSESKDRREVREWGLSGGLAGRELTAKPHSDLCLPFTILSFHWTLLEGTWYVLAGNRKSDVVAGKGF